MKWFAYDCEVFKYDWIVIFKNLQTEKFTVIHNNKTKLERFLTQDTVTFGFNSKFYDRYILKAILMGHNNMTVKALSDYIVTQQGMAWEHWSLAGKQTPFFHDVDIRNDMQKGLSLKAIEGHMGLNIEETSVDFALDRPLTNEELKSTIHYCTHDVETTARIVKTRIPYLKTKATLAKMGGIDVLRALDMTNAKLVAEFLQAESAKYHDERVYNPPEAIKFERIPDEVRGFYSQIEDSTVSDEEFSNMRLTTKLAGVPTTYGLGGIHGAIPKFTFESEEVIK